MLFDACVDMYVTCLFEVGIDEVSESHDVLEAGGGGWMRLCAGGSFVGGLAAVGTIGLFSRLG